MSEQEYFDLVMTYISEKLNEEISSFDDLKRFYQRDPERYYVPYSLACQTINTLQKSKDKPYFARIDFKEENKKEEKFYIGRNGIMDDSSNLLVIDWRAPVAGVYYDSDIGKTSYYSPQGIVNGELLLKRQFDIENGKLERFYDVDLVSNDDLLQKYLSANNDVRLKNIVATIQKEQNKAIRQGINKNIIVQGVAGSGKTTIALHRIAYLAYNYRNRIKNNQYLVIGPNQVFLKYIENVLPDLDVNGIDQKTFESFAKDVIGEDIVVKSSSEYLAEYLNNTVKDNIPKFKNSLEFMNMLNNCINDYFMSIGNENLELKGYVILEQKKLKSILEIAFSETTNFKDAIERFVLLGSSYIEKHKGEIMQSFNNQSSLLYAESKRNNTTAKYQKDKEFVYNEINKYCKATLRKYISKYNLSPLKMYKKFINEIEKYDSYKYPYLLPLKKQTLGNIKNNLFDFEDLAPLMHIKYKFGINDSEKNYRHVVVDEAQDFGLFNYVTLKECLPNATFSIYGDIAQSIYDYRSIDSWEEVKNIMNAEIIPFNKSYRTTDEIMEVANSVSEYLKLEPSELSVRHGDSVSFEKVDQSDIAQCIKNKIEQYKKLGYQTIAVVSKYPIESSKINADLRKENIQIANISEMTDITQDDQKIATIANYLSKGLEFDVVIINNASEDVYDSNSSADMKMLYVALTRALHKLDIIYDGEITKPLQKFIDKSKVLVR